MSVIISYPNCPAYAEKVQAKDLGDGRAMLTSHADFIPLAPGDVVTIDGEQVTGVEWLAPLHTVLVHFYLPADIPAFATPTEQHKGVRAFHRVIEIWKSDPALSVTTPAGFTALVSAGSLEALVPVVRHQYVESWDTIRTPEMPFDWAFAMKRADIGTMEGPWA